MDNASIDITGRRHGTIYETGVYNRTVGTPTMNNTTTYRVTR